MIGVVEIRQLAIHRKHNRWHIDVDDRIDHIGRKLFEHLKSLIAKYA
jgi:hypothetical protein